MESLIIEIRAGTGGLDSKQLCEEQMKLYLKYCARKCF